MMKNICIFLLGGLVVSGCLWSKSPYDYLDNWLLREDAVRTFAAPIDVIYVQDALYLRMDELHSMSSYARDAVGRGKFSGVARVFSPLVANAKDVKDALDWYIKYHGDEQRTIVFIGEGEGGALLRAYAEENAEELSDKGFVKGFYSEKHRPGFVSEDMVREIRNLAVGARYKRQWGREMPAGMLEQ